MKNRLGRPAFESKIGEIKPKSQASKDAEFLKFRARENAKDAKKEARKRAQRHPGVSRAPHPGHSSEHH